MNEVREKKSWISKLMSFQKYFFAICVLPNCSPEGNLALILNFAF